MDIGVEGQGGRGPANIFAFLTTEPNKEVAEIYPKAMPMILRSHENIDIWMTAPINEALQCQCPLPDGSLRIVARGEKEDRATGTW